MNPAKAAHREFEILTHDEKLAAIGWLQDIGFSEHGIARATRLSVEMIRAILAKRRTHG